MYPPPQSRQPHTHTHAYSPEHTCICQDHSDWEGDVLYDVVMGQDTVSRYTGTKGSLRRTHQEVENDGET